MSAKLEQSASRPGVGSRTQQARLWSGLILFAYVVTHFINHSLGHWSLEAMESMLAVTSWFWTTLVGSILLYGALFTHFALGFVKIVSVRTLKRPLWEWLQILFAILIPVYLASHIIYTRHAERTIGIEVTYLSELSLLYPGAAVQQNLLLLFVWIHACIGIHYWLRLKKPYNNWLPLWSALALLIPMLAITGWLAAARRQADQLFASIGDDGFSEEFEEQREMIGFIINSLRGDEQIIHNVLYGIAALGLVIIAARVLADRIRTNLTVQYGDGKSVSASPGTTLLDISRKNGISHMAVCGGRARCSTCRTLVTEGVDNLSTPQDAERNLLMRLNAPENVRLACQARITGNVQIRPLIQTTGSGQPATADPLGWGVERNVAIMFLDIRGFSRISEKSLPYDVVFILNSFFGEVTAEIEANNGYVDKFMGDGLMAIFGLVDKPTSDGSKASSDALKAAVAVQKAASSASRVLTQHLEQPIRIGVGIHTGQAIIGRIGRTSDQTTPSRLTAIGDTVNIAARLESATKDFKSGIVVSGDTARLAGIGHDKWPGETSTITVHNITKPIHVMATNENEMLYALLE